ncbi:RagB/SusD family nutrient uptake outer membrane protein [Mangrovibacterium diazotrophicum]|uniref:Putative outer membrane starch-binding protein n=1 Tax=Mangrovibacterium diazotrophicum TaxID=1261403 RepID=A0A419W5H1_9BACT|nr:RagB/SusD family nutrient uptake outer membrane protein [Mangrovibacterium diazotrophicum]RKD90709.1 putative outer membrane starch-binding protein [Mangrovibacterium diazotrophicum]
MNTKKLIYLVLGVCLGLTSCSDDFLTLYPETVISAGDFYETEADFQLAIVGNYVPLRNLYGTGAADYGAWSMGEMRSDNTGFIYNTSNRGYADREYVDQFIDDSNGGPVSNKYQNDFIIIGRANQILKYIDDADISDDARNNYKGQALFLRAFAYFDLVQYFGGVPLVTTPPTSYEETLQTRATVAEIYTQIIADATLAAEILPSFSEQEKGYVANGAAYTLLGNAYLVLEEWANAETALSNVSGYSLQSDYAAIFDPSNKNNSEMIFEVQYSDDLSASANSMFAYNFLPILSNPGVISGFPNGNTNGYGGWNTPTPEMIAAYESGDLRFDASIQFYSGEGYDNIPYVKKYVHGAVQHQVTDDDWPVYRYAEVLLMIAEAKNEQGDVSGALTYLNMVHAHSRTGLSALSISDQTAMREAIMTERRVELAFENKRWPDLVRWGNAAEVMSAQFAKIKANPTDYYYPAGVELASTAYNFQDFRLLFPIPEREINIYPNIEQNPGY